MNAAAVRAMIFQLLRKRPYFVAGCLGIAACVSFNLLLGQDTNFDARNYHIASVYRLIHRREQIDFIFQAQTWFNPIGYLPAYILIFWVPPIAAGSGLALLQGLAGLLVYELWRRVYRVRFADDRALITTWLSVVVAVTGALFLSEAGTTFTDGLLALPLIGAIMLLLEPVRSAKLERAALLFILSGILFGAVVGLKLTNAVFGFGLFGMILVAKLPVSRKAMLLVLFSAGVVAGFVAVAGWWHYLLFRYYGNPVYPLAGNLFRNDLSFSGELADRRFLPEHWYGYFWYPVRMALGTAPVLNASHYIGAEVRFRDVRYLAGLMSAIGFVLLYAREMGGKAPRQRMLLQLSIFFLVSYVLWMTVFGIARYAIVLELLGGGLTLALVDRLSPPRMATVLTMVVAIAIVVSTRPGAWGRLPYSDSWFGAEALGGMPPATYVLSSEQPLAFVSAFVPPNSRVVRVGGTIALDPDHGPGRRVSEIISGSAELASVRDSNAPDDDAALLRFGLRKVANRCMVVPTRISALHVCRLERVPISQPVVVNRKADRAGGAL